MPTRRPTLTPRQAQILALIWAGRQNSAIAAQLQLSCRTIEVHRYQLMKKMGASNVAQLLRGALRKGLLTRP